MIPVKKVLRHPMAFPTGLTIVFCLVGVVIASALRYQPIELQVGPTGPQVFHADGTPIDNAVKDVPGLTPTDPALPMATLTAPGSVVSVSYILSGRGRFPVKILAIGSPGDYPAPTVKVLIGGPNSSAATRPFRSFTLRHGDLRLITMVFRPRFCPGSNDPQNYTTYIAGAEMVTYSFLGATHHTMISYQGTGYGIRGINTC